MLDHRPGQRTERKPDAAREMDPRVGGFSLFEVLLVVVIMSVLLSIAAPSPEQRDRRIVRLAADQYASAHKLARATGIRYGSMGELHVDAARGRYWIEVDTSGTGLTDTIGVVRDLTRDGIAIKTTWVLVCFDGRGLPDLRENSRGEACESTEGLAIFSRRNNADTLEVTTMGKVVR